MTFRLQNQRILLTYKTHLDKDALIVMVNVVHKTTFCRVAHETGKHDDEADAYPHTHVLVDFGQAVNIRNCRAFDVGDIHPNMKPIRSMAHMKNAMAYLAKEDHANDDLLALSKQSYAERVWGHDSMQEALMKINNPCEVMATIALYKAKPREDYRSPVPEAWRPWQQELLDILAGPVNDRHVIWICDKVGGQGKSVLARYIEDYMDGVMLTQMGGARDTATILENEGDLSGRPIIIDLPRQAQDKDIYSPIEMMKNGRMTIIKYQGGKLRWRPGHLVVMANFEPDRTKWSTDRYRLYDLVDGVLNIR